VLPHLAARLLIISPSHSIEVLSVPPLNRKVLTYHSYIILLVHTFIRSIKMVVLNKIYITCFCKIMQDQ
jgi:hypothetical protein